MAINFYSVFEESQKKLKEITPERFLAKSTAIIDSTLQSIFPKWDDVDLHYEVHVVLKDKRKSSLIKLLFLSYSECVGENLGWYLRSALIDEVKHNIDLVDLVLPLKSASHFKVWLSELIQRRGLHWFFGNFLNAEEWKSLFEGNIPYSIKRRRNHRRYNDVYPEKRRVGVGYNDKGTLPNDPRGSLKNFMLTSVQNEIESNRDKCESLQYLIEGFLT